ncbi:universal stress protein [Desulfospira joergensenii]|uniref:universal stress protein n=1 Tax=Desulfospira joergensenii TaxID=53329 RepID=UPI0003B6C72A|nr:universal stress protein [Desulfospira joergensenii]
MNRKILIPFNESECAKNTVTFVAEHLDKDHEITLFHVVPDTAAACGLDSPSLTPYFEKERNAFCRMEERRQDMMLVTLETAKMALLNAGFSDAKIHVKTQAQNKGIAADIVQEVKKGNYGMVAMGRRSVSGIKDFFMGSNVLRVMNALGGIPMVIVD